ncbi:MAG: M55 family metallopeptidase [Planctomycetes bacterium]|jgi:D-amino peptidase|nr:M55 family metallopeptidase [Planctomycetota bacterium]
MKVLISVDYEGIAGIFSWPDRGDMDLGQHLTILRRLMTEETNAAILGVLDADPDAEIVVGDSHDTARNLLPESLHPRAELIGGWPRELSMVEGIDRSVDLLFLVGYHARAGAIGGALDHTYSGSTVAEVRINGRPVGETELNAGVAGHFGVPLALVSGDDVLMRDLEESVDPLVKLVVVKRGISRYASRSLHPEEARRRIREAARQAASAKKRPKPLVFGGRCRLEMDLKSTAMTYAARDFPAVDCTGGRTFRFQPAKDYVTLFKRLMAFLEFTNAYK